MKVPCDYCGKELDRQPARIRNNKFQFCNFECLGNHRRRPVDVTCAICGKTMTVRPSQTKNGKKNICSNGCLIIFRSEVQIRFRGPAPRKSFNCLICGNEFKIRISQLGNWEGRGKYCSRTCQNESKRGPKPEMYTGQWYQCERCKKQVWRVPNALQKHVFCSRKCANQTRPGKNHYNVKRLEFACAECGKSILKLKSQLTKSNIVYCSKECRQNGYMKALLYSNSKRKGKPGKAWSEEQKHKVSASLQASYATEQGAARRQFMSRRMIGSGNPSWRGGLSIEPYTEGWGRWRSRQIRKRDGYKCQSCSSKLDLVVHHKDGGKTDHSDGNLITVCQSCHGLIHSGKIQCP